MRKWILLGLWVSVSVQAKPCARLLANSFGVYGPLIATLDGEGRLKAWGSQNHQTRYSLAKSSRSLATLPLAHDALFATVMEDGSAYLTVPPGVHHPINLALDFQPVSIALWRAPVVEKQIGSLQISEGIRTLHGADAAADLETFREFGEEPLIGARNARSRAKVSAFLESHLPITVWIATRERLYRSTLSHLDLDKQPTELANAVHTHPVVLAFADGSWKGFNSQVLNLTDDTNRRRILRTPNPRWALVLSHLELVFEATGPLEVTGIDFIHPISEKYVLVANEPGAVALIDTETRQVTQHIRFPHVSWVTSITGYMLQDVLEIWAIAADDSLYRWRSDEVGAIFRKQEFPAGIHPLRVTSFATPVPPGSVTHSTDGPPTNLRLKNEHSTPEVQQVLVLDGKGDVHIAVDEPTSFLDPFGPTETRWVPLLHAP